MYDDDDDCGGDDDDDDDVWTLLQAVRSVCSCTLNSRIPSTQQAVELTPRALY